MSCPPINIQPTTHYDVLQVSPSALDEEIRKSFLRLALEWHPDKNLDMEKNDTEFSDNRFKRISEAYEVLSDPTSRRRYDLSMAATPTPSNKHHQPNNNIPGTFRFNIRWTGGGRQNDSGSDTEDKKKPEKASQVFDNFIHKLFGGGTIDLISLIFGSTTGASSSPSAAAPAATQVKPPDGDQKTTCSSTKGQSRQVKQENNTGRLTGDKVFRRGSNPVQRSNSNCHEKDIYNDSDTTTQMHNNSSSTSYSSSTDRRRHLHKVLRTVAFAGDDYRSSNKEKNLNYNASSTEGKSFHKTQKTSSSSPSSNVFYHVMHRKSPHEVCDTSKILRASYRTSKSCGNDHLSRSNHPFCESYHHFPMGTKSSSSSLSRHNTTPTLTPPTDGNEIEAELASRGPTGIIGAPSFTRTTSSPLTGMDNNSMTCVEDRLAARGKADISSPHNSDMAKQRKKKVSADFHFIPAVQQHNGVVGRLRVAPTRSSMAELKHSSGAANSFCMLNAGMVDSGSSVKRPTVKVYRKEDYIRAKSSSNLSGVLGKKQTPLRRDGRRSTEISNRIIHSSDFFGKGGPSVKGTYKHVVEDHDGSNSMTCNRVGSLQRAWLHWNTQERAKISH